jgi:NADH-quinone oxidoreductase subunit A
MKAGLSLNEAIAGRIMLESYFPVFVFILIGVAFGIAPVITGSRGWAASPGQRKAFALRVRLRGLRRCAHEVRCALLPDRHPLHPVRPRSGLPVCRGRRFSRRSSQTESVKWFGFIEMLVFIAILVVGYVYAWAKGALDWE